MKKKKVFLIFLLTMTAMARFLYAADALDAEARIRSGNDFYSKGLPDKAVGEYKQALKMDSKLFEAQYNLALALSDLNRFDEAIEQYKKAIKLNPNDSDAHFNLGNCYAHKKLYKDAIRAYEQAARLNPADADATANLNRAKLSLKAETPAPKKTGVQPKLSPAQSKASTVKDKPAAAKPATPNQSAKQNFGAKPVVVKAKPVTSIPKQNFSAKPAMVKAKPATSTPKQNFTAKEDSSAPVRADAPKAYKGSSVNRSLVEAQEKIAAEIEAREKKSQKVIEVKKAQPLRTEVARQDTEAGRAQAARQDAFKAGELEKDAKLKKDREDLERKRTAELKRAEQERATQAEITRQDALKKDREDLERKRTAELKRAEQQRATQAESRRQEDAKKQESERKKSAEAKKIADQQNQALIAAKFYNTGNTSLRAGRLNDAVQAYDQALKIMPSDADTHFMRGVAFDKKTLAKEAMQEYTEALRLNPKYAEAQYNWAVLLYKQGKKVEARDKFEAYLKQASPEQTQQIKSAKQALQSLSQKNTLSSN